MEVLQSLDELRVWAQRPLSLTVGFFDGVHRGHAHLLQRLTAAAQAHNAHSLVITFANSPRAFHQHGGEWRYLTLPDEKLELLGETGIDVALMLAYDTSVATQTGLEFFQGIAACRPLSALVMGYDTSVGSDMLRGESQFQALARKLQAELDFVEAFLWRGQAVKSSMVRRLVRAGEMARGRDLLGHPYYIMGSVGSGKGRGGELLGAPTANVYLPREKIAPPTGVYAGLADAGGARFPAAIVVLTVEESHHTVIERVAAAQANARDPAQVIVEAHLIGYRGDLYGAPLALRFLERLRDFRDFTTPDALAEQIRRDIAAAVELAALEGTR